MSPQSVRAEHHLFAQLATHQCDQADLDQHLSDHPSDKLDQSIDLFVKHFSRSKPVAALWFWALAIGMLLGGLTMVGLLSYSGEKPINFLWLMLFFIALPLLIMLVSWLLILSQKQPPSFWHQLPVLKKLHLALLMPPVRFYLHWLNQWAGLGYSLGGMSVFIIVVTGQDLAFGWASTLTIAPEQLHQLTTFLASPWHWFTDQAVPSLSLIENSQFFQWQANRDQLDPNLLRQWWSFLAMAIVFYSVFVRLLSLLMSHYLLKRSLIKHWPVSPLAKAWYADQEANKSQPASYPRHFTGLDNLQPIHIGWRLGSGEHRLIDASLGLETVAHDQQLIKQLLAKKPKQLTVWVKAFESPQAELNDLLMPFQASQITLALFSPNIAILDSAYISWERFAKASSLSMSITEVKL